MVGKIGTENEALMRNLLLFLQRSIISYIVYKMICEINILIYIKKKDLATYKIKVLLPKCYSTELNTQQPLI